MEDRVDHRRKTDEVHGPKGTKLSKVTFADMLKSLSEVSPLDVHCERANALCAAKSFSGQTCPARWVKGRGLTNETDTLELGKTRKSNGQCQDLKHMQQLSPSAHTKS